MAATIVVSCPSCKKQLKGPAELQGKKVRCKSCGHTFAVGATSSGTAPTNPPAASATKRPATAAAQSPKAGSAAPPAKADARQKGAPKSPPKAPEKPAAPPKPADSIVLKPTESAELPPNEAPPPGSPAASDSLKRPYGLTEESKGINRCPQCAFEMDEGAIICLECGFNTETRARMSTIRAYETTGADRMGWLLPGILCAVVLLLMVTTILFLWLLLPRLAGDEWYGGLWLQIWGSVIAAFIGWFTGRFAFKRLIMNPIPPEKLK